MHARANLKQGELLSFKEKSELAPAVATAAFALAEDGQLAPVIQTPEGFLVIQRVAKQPATYKPLAAVKGDIAAHLGKQKFHDLFMSEARDLVSDAGVNEPLFTPFVEKHGGVRGELRDISREEREKDKLTKMLFRLSNGQADTVLDGEKAYIVRLDSITEKKIPALETVRSRVVNDWYADQTHKLLQKKLQEARAQLHAGKSLSDVAQSLGARVTAVGPLRADEAGKKRLEELGIPGNVPFGLSFIGAHATYLGNQDGLVIELKELTPLQETGPLQEKLQREQEMRRLVLDGFVAALRRSATIESNSAVMQTEAEYSL
jgi:hypothetical protein